MPVLNTETTVVSGDTAISIYKTPSGAIAISVERTRTGEVLTGIVSTEQFADLAGPLLTPRVGRTEKAKAIIEEAMSMPSIPAYEFKKILEDLAEALDESDSKLDEEAAELAKATLSESTVWGSLAPSQRTFYRTLARKAREIHKGVK